MDFALSANQESIRDAVGKICSRFDDAYWLKKDKEGGYPADFHRALADAGWLGICIPEEYGGSGLGITDASIMMHTIAASMMPKPEPPYSSGMQMPSQPASANARWKSAG